MLGEFVSEIRYRLIDWLRTHLALEGLRVEAPARLFGSSGALHWAALSATGPDGRTILVDIHVSHDTVDEEPVISTYAKVLDTSPSQTFLLVMPKVNNAASELAKSYDISLIEGVSVEDLITKFKEQFPLKPVQT